METFTWVPDHEYKENLEYDVDHTTYISGYQQRYLNNPDPIVHKFTLEFHSRSNTEIQAIVDFLKARKGSWNAFYYVGLFDGGTYSVHLVSPIPPATQTSVMRRISLVFEVIN